MIIWKPLEYEDLLSQKCLQSSNLPGSPRTRYFLRVYLCVLVSHLPSGAIFTSRFPGIQFIFLGYQLVVEGVPACGREMEWDELEASKPNPSGWSYHSHTLSLYLHIQHYITDHNLQWQKDAAVKVITLNWERCLASFNLCHLPERQSNECTQKSLHKIIQQEPYTEWWGTSKGRHQQEWEFCCTEAAASK